MIKEIKVDHKIILPSFEHINIVLCEGNNRCQYEWILSLRDQCIKHKVPFYFTSTGPELIKNGTLYRIDTYEQNKQANKAQIDISPFDSFFHRLSHSDFRSQFTISPKDHLYIEQKGWNTIEAHACDFIASRLAPAQIINDGKQTPMRGHPVFKAQHATGTCCRDCLYKWHRIPSGRFLTENQQNYIVTLLMEWIIRKYYKKDGSY